MNMDAQKIPGLVLRCDWDGTLTQVVKDDFGLAEGVAVGKPVTALTERGNFGKMLSFLVELRSQGAAFDWQINVCGADQIVTLNFAGAVVEQTLLILAAGNRDGLMRLYEEMMQIANEQMNAFRAAVKDRSELANRHGRESDLYFDEMTRLNNELANLQRELAKKNSELERLNAQKNQFIGMAAHDLRNPLSAIRIYTEFLLDEVGAALTAEHREFLTIVCSSSEFMLRLIEDFLDVATIASGKLRLERWPVDLAVLVKNNLALNRLIASKKGTTLRFIQEGECPKLLLDASKIDQVLNNLIGNAIKFSPPASAVTVRLVCATDEALIAVTDQGPGIPAAEIGKMFDLFERTSVKSTGGEKSSGLGLAIARKIVLEHGGRLWVESESGQGSTFYVALPLSG